MKMDSLISTTANAFGVRFVWVGLLPSALLVVITLCLFFSGAPAQAPDPSLVLTRLSGLSTAQGTILFVVLMLLTVILHPLQLGLVKLLEGYWGESQVGKFFSKIGIWYHLRHYKKLEAAARIQQTGKPISVEEMSRMAHAADVLLNCYPAKDRLLPTLFGNILRAGEQRPNKRYGLDAVVMWPRIYTLLPSPLKATMADQRNQIDSAVRFLMVFILITVISALFLFKHGWWLSVPLFPLGLGWLSYRSAVAAALGYGKSIQVAFDLHRFDLLKQMHLPMPVDREAEKRQNTKLSDFLRQDFPFNAHYEHDPAKK